MGSAGARAISGSRPSGLSRAAWRVPIDRSRRDGAFWPESRGFRGLFCRTVRQGWWKLAPRALGDVWIVVIRYSGVPGRYGGIRTGMAQGWRRERRGAGEDQGRGGGRGEGEEDPSGGREEGKRREGEGRQEARGAGSRRREGRKRALYTKTPREFLPSLVNSRVTASRPPL